MLTQSQFRKGYLDDLKRRIKNETRQLRRKRMYPNSDYKVLPLPSKALGKIELYTLVSTFLQKITDPITATQIIQRLTEDKIEYIANTIPLIEKYMRENHRLGVNEEDFIKYLNSKV